MSKGPDVVEVFSRSIASHLEVVRQIGEQQLALVEIAALLARALRCGNRIYWCGNGGSAADCQHLAAEIVGRFRLERRGLPSVALTTDSSVLTAVANDYGFEMVFARQVEALGQRGDVLVGISTSGNSPNVVAALAQARLMKMKTVAMTGAGGGQMRALADFHFQVASQETARVQEAHILAGHMLCDWIEQDWMHAEERMQEVAIAAQQLVAMNHEIPQVLQLP